jgi:TRAP-type mannitol/chloroaromatic compound transport system substrate-binding protein
MWMLCESEAKNNIYLEKMVKEDGVQLKAFPDDVINQLRVYADEVLQEIIEKDPMSKKVYESFSKFHKNHLRWGQSSEAAYYSLFS